jgi:hypothetical protein
MSGVGTGGGGGGRRGFGVDGPLSPMTSPEDEDEALHSKCKPAFGGETESIENYQM